MADVDADADTTALQEDDHRASYIFHPDDAQAEPAAVQPAKKRKLSTKKNARGTAAVGNAADELSSPSLSSSFVPLFNGAESAQCVRRREELFERAWADVDSRIQDVLREANRNTLDEVEAFVRNAPDQTDRIPAAFIITGPNIASQDLLFEQLAETLREAVDGRVVRLRSAEAPNLKATLKKIIRDGTAQAELDGDAEDPELAVGQDGRKYLDYDLEALYASLRTQRTRRVIIAFQDSEGFDGGLLSDLITLFSCWHDRIHVSLLFGVATSVELLQARLLKSAARLLYGSQFDVVQANYVLESVFKSAVAGNHVLLRLGPSLLRTLVDRQQEHVAGVQVFTSSLKYAYMCHFYANPLSALCSHKEQLNRGLLQPEHLRAVRTLASFKAHVEAAVEARQLNHAHSLIEDDKYLTQQILEQSRKTREYSSQFLRSLYLMEVVGAPLGSFIDLYIGALAGGIDLSSAETHPIIDHVQKLPADEFVALVGRLLGAIKNGSPELSLDGWESDMEDSVGVLAEIQGEMEALITQSKDKGKSLKSKYGAQSKVLRTTVVAQKVQLSRDTATLTDGDKAFTAAIDRLTEMLSAHIFCDSVDGVFLNEIFVYDAKSPYRDVFIPRPGAAVQRALFRPHDYLACTCCSKANGEIAPTLPAASILYHLYLETGALINVADMWSAFHALVGEEGGANPGYDERTALVHFYRGLAELRALGFVKPSKKKADHIAKVKWL